MAQAEWIPHPYLHEPLLYVTGLLPHVTEGDLARALENCVPFRPSIPRGGTDTTLSGTIEFRSIDRGASNATEITAFFQANIFTRSRKSTRNASVTPDPARYPPAYLILTPYAPHSATTLPPPAAQARIVKMLPPGFTDSAVYDLFRPYGPLASVRIQANQPENAIVEYWHEENAVRAQEDLHYQEVGDRNISVQIYSASGRKSDFSPTAAPFVPQGMQNQHPYPVPQINHPPSRQFVHGPGQQVQYAPMAGPGSNSHSGLIDPCNLFIKNIDPEIDSNALFSHFRHYGSIVSARVMRDERGQSRGFGFVSYQAPDQASRALAATNNARLGSKSIIVRLHEPRQLRQEKLAARFSGNNHPRTSSGATSPTLSDDLNLDNASVYMGPGNNSLDGAVEKSRQPPETRPRRNSGSYYHAALAGTLNLPMRFEELSALSPVVRREVIAGELTRRISQHPDLPNMAQTDIDAAVERLAQSPLQDIVDMMHDPYQLGARVRGDVSSGEASPSRQPSREPSVDSRSQNNPTTASAPEHPSTPAAISTPARTSSPTPSLGAAVSSRLTNAVSTPLPPAASERDRFAAAVGALEPDATRAESIVDLLLTLSKTERAKMLFSREFMRTKVEEAKAILATVDATEDQPVSAPALPVTPAKKNILTADDSPRTPALSSRGPSTVTSPEPTPATPPSNNVPLASVAKTLAALSAKEIIARAPGAGLPGPDPTVVRDNDSYVDGLASRSPANQKQAVGEKLFKIVKTFDSRAAPKVTIQLLDQEDLRALVHLMNEYPSVLREKVAIVAAQIGTRK
ncbi:hypothetical protein BKA62DRAFT_826128 [Auriculariales sp. MPI-PUGE-AT-0066]|nr:hypothetical protein BKA62DRAFT_826128 [Auriculariales sp. MPI-PUGE-AT-0066]